MKNNIKYRMIIVLIIFAFLQVGLFNTIISFSVEENNAKTSQVIENGTYIIRSAINEKYVLDVTGPSKANGVNIQLFEDAQVDQQKFKVTYLGDGYYSIISIYSGKSLDVDSGSKKNGANVQQYEANNTAAQTWKIVKNSDGTCSISSKCNGLYVDVEAATAKNKSNIQMYAGNGTIAQKFKLEAVDKVNNGSDDNNTKDDPIEQRKKTVEDGNYIIRSAINEKYVLDVTGPSKANGVNIQLFEEAQVEQQKFKITYLGDGYYRITSVYSEKSLDVDSGSKKNGANVQQYEANNTAAQTWVIVENSDNTYSIVSKCNGLYVDVESATAKNKANIQMYAGNGTIAQKFKLEAVDKVTDGSGDNNTKDDPIEQRKKTVEDGNYIIRSAINEKYVLDVTGPSKANGVNIQLFEEAQVEQQKFKITYLGDGYYRITSVYSKKSLDVDGASKENGANVQQYEANNTAAQTWVIVENSDNTYSIVSKCNGLYVDVESATAKNKANIQMYAGNGTIAQKFKLEAVDKVTDGSGDNNTKDDPIEQRKKTVEDGNYIIRSAINEKYVLDVTGPSKANGANIQLFEDARVSQQRFKVTYLGDGYYRITSIYSKKSLDVDGASKENGANVQQYEANNTAAQTWVIVENSDNTYSIVSKCNGLFVDVEAATAKNKSNIQMYAGNGTIAQKFKLEKVENPVDSINTAKYPGYKEKIEALMDAHPDWNFELLYTGLKFDDVIAGEYAVHSRNLVPNNYGGEWICPTCGTKLYDSGWYCASEKAIAYYMDPRNFLDDTNVFQFQDVNEYISGVCTLAGIQSKVNGTFLQNYATDIDNACRNQNVNSYYIIARVLQEQGTTGTSIGKGMDGGDGKTYYNPFNIGAYGNGWSEIYANALARAKQEGWDTMQKALEGGITFCKKNWLENYQNTLYQNKFDIDTRNGTALYEHQYMQNLMAAYSEGRTLRSMYVNTGKIESGFTFIIPMYEEMNAGLSPLPENNTETSPINVKITANGGLNIRKEANTSSEALRTIAQGEIILSVQRGINSNWQKVITTDGLIGYMSGTYLKQVDDVTNCNYQARVKTNDGSGCKIRIGPSLKLDLITALSEGTQVTVINEGTYNNIDGFNWCRIRLSDGRQAFMPVNYLARC